ncbi:hypothetical protein PMI15_04647 [Polaromonas sp. CF318]|uniref:hypothetical protein n=1 Tax=Polaromonas sp. CF318 TaxID=1144318 RepID=UPI0002713DA2|nr:hypothetical protein [Polaromonas sp. CF318]EJL77558.1 hypothetical protein PMI15_04647 [Polaromonas sp. CF318]
MCSPLALLHALAIIGLVGGFIGGALHDGKLESYFEQKHPEVWADLAQRKLMFVEGDMQTAAMHQYLRRGEHKKLEDAELNAMVFRGWLWVALLLGSAVVLMFVQDRVSMDSYRACLGLLL